VVPVAALRPAAPRAARRQANRKAESRLADKGAPYRPWPRAADAFGLAAWALWAPRRSPLHNGVMCFAFGRVRGLRNLGRAIERQRRPAHERSLRSSAGMARSGFFPASCRLQSGCAIGSSKRPAAGGSESRAVRRRLGCARLQVGGAGELVRGKFSPRPKMPPPAFRAISDRKFRARIALERRGEVTPYPMTTLFASWVASSGIDQTVRAAHQGQLRQ
jgi:hypothetical protein